MHLGFDALLTALLLALLGTRKHLRMLALFLVVVPVASFFQSDVQLTLQCIAAPFSWHGDAFKGHGHLDVANVVDLALCSC